MKKESLISFMREIAGELKKSGNLGTAHVYRSSLNAILTFHGSEKLMFHQLTPEWLKRFEGSLRNRECSWNTVSTYIRTLRAVYNRAIERKIAVYVPQLFRSVYTGTRADRQRALDMEDIKKIFIRLPQSSAGAVTSTMRDAQEWFILMFLLRGLPFVDFVYLRKSDLRGNVITYRRRKTGRSLSVTLAPEAMVLLQKHMNRDIASPYLFPVLKSGEGTEKAYREYQLALRSFNYQLALLGKFLGLKEHLSSYTARHTWATTAYYCEIHPGIISEAMGHSSIMVTETYLKPFHSQKIDDANGQIIAFVKRSIGGTIV